MLLQFSCSNFRSIKNEITFSMLSDDEDSNNKRILHFNKLDIERITAIYGANGSGKSNFISAIDFARNLVINSMTFQPGRIITTFPHKLLDDSVPCVFSFQFEFNNIRYAYSFSISHGFVDDEYLYYFPNNKRTKIFSRKGMNIIPGSKYQNSFQLSLNVLQENRLFLSCAANFSRAEEIKNAFVFFDKTIVVYKVNVDEPRSNNWYEYSANIMQTKPDIKAKFLQIMKFLDTGVKDIKTETKKFSADDLTNILPEPLKNSLDFILPDIKKNGFMNIKTTLRYDKFETDLLTEESTGIQKLVQMICPMLDILENGKVLICDEIETGLHEAIVHKIIELFYALYPERKAQFIFTTHDTSLLDSKLFRRCQIWFTQLTDERATDLYSLSEIRNVRKDENLARGYINGKYGAIPVLNHNIQSLLNG